MMANRDYLDPQLTTLLDRLRQHVRKYVVWDSVLAMLLVVLVAFWLGLALDYLPVMIGGTEMPREARLLLLLVVGFCVCFIASKMLIGRLRRPLPDDSLALLIERHHPELAGRLVTTVQLNEPGRQGDSHSRVLLNRVHRETAAVVDQVDTRRVFRWQPVLRKLAVVAPLAISLIGFAIISPKALGRAVSRLTLASDDPWPRRAKLEMVGVELPVITAADEESPDPEMISFEDRELRLPRGSNATLRIRAEADTAEVPVVCTVFYRTEDGTRGQTNMRRVGRVTDGYQSFVLDGPPLSDLAESFTFSVRGLDDRLDDFSIEAVTPPAISKMRIKVRYPDYLRDDSSEDYDLETDYQSGLRIAEGSDVTLVATSSRPLGETDVAIKTDAGVGEPDETTYVDDRTEVQFLLKEFGSATTVRLVPKDADGISAQAPYRYFVGVVIDEPPTVQLRLNGIGTAVTPVARLPLETTAEDDYGIEQLKITASPTTEGQEESSASVQPKLDRDGNAATVMDLRDLVSDGELAEIKPGAVVNVFAEATDRYDLDGTHLTRSEVFRLQVVTPEELLALLERRELGMRARLEQTIDETRTLRETLELLRRRSFSGTEPEPEDPVERTRELQVRRLRVQQTGLQAKKTSEELDGIATSLDDMLREMVNNRVDSADRRERIGDGVRDPLKKIIAEPLARLQDQISQVEKLVAKPPQAAQKTAEAVETAEEVLLQLTAVLDKMLDLESFNEILDLYRELIDDQEDLSEQTKEEQKKKVLELLKQKL